MTAVRRRGIVWGLGGAALLALLAYAVGRYESRSGGLVVVERWLDHPVLLVGTAVVLTAVALYIGMEFRTWVSQIGCAVAMVALVFGGPLIAFLALVSGEGRTARTAAPGHPDRVLTMTNMASIDPVYRVELVAGSGWSARHWSMGIWDTRGGDFVRADWSGPDRITITGRKKLTVFDVHPDGSLSAPREEPKPPEG